MSNSVIAIVGRPNVGKSTFFNRMLKQKKAIVDAQEGITRDRIYGEMEWLGHYLTFIDTGGYIPEDVDIFNNYLSAASSFSPSGKKDTSAQIICKVRHFHFDEKFDPFLVHDFLIEYDNLYLIW